MGCFDGNGTERQNTEFAKAVPTNGFGEVEATVIASLGHPSAPQPRPIATVKVKKKVCRIYSPVSIDRGKGGLRGRRREQRDVLQRPHTVDTTVINRTLPMGAVMSGLGKEAQEATESARLMAVPRRSRPMTSDSLSRRQYQHPQRGQAAECTTSSRIHGDTTEAAEGDKRRRPSTSGGRSRRRPTGSFGEKDRRSAFDAMGWARRTSEGETREQQLQLQRQQGKGPPAHAERKRRHNTSHLQISNRPATADSSKQSPQPQARAGRIEEASTPPNRYWPTPGGAKKFLRPFLERNQKQLWAYDPAFVGMGHMEAYRHIVSKGDFEATKRTLLEKEDALTKGTGSFLMADVIKLFRVNSEREPVASTTSMEDGPHQKADSTQRYRRRALLSTGPATMMESDPFLSADCNGDKRRKEEARRRDLLKQARARSNIFCRRKGYEPGDFLKHRSLATTTGNGVPRSSRPPSRARKRTVVGVAHEKTRLL